MLHRRVAVEVLDRYLRGEGYPWNGERLETPRNFMQYWDHDPPGQITEILAHNRRVCEADGFDYQFFDDATAREYILWHFGEMALQAYDKSSHAAIKCDLFRLCWLAKTGGFYLDADMVVRDRLPPLDECAMIVFKFNEETASGGSSRPRRHIPNGMIISAPGHELIERLAANAAARVFRAAQVLGADAVNYTNRICGPAFLTRLIGTYVHRKLERDEPGLALNFMDANDVRAFIGDGRVFLGKPLEYKKDNRSWQVASGLWPPGA
jgi:hypothetical protein